MFKIYSRNILWGMIALFGVALLPLPANAETVRPSIEIPEDIQKMGQKTCSRKLEGLHYIRENEYGKLKWNHVFGEVKNEEHAKDIQQLYDIVAEDMLNDCHYKLAYYRLHMEKWYGEENRQKKQKYDAIVAELKSKVTDTGSEIWDGIIGDVYFHIPRNHIWSGSRVGDGYLLGINLLFQAPDMGTSDKNSPYGEHSDIAGILSIITNGETGRLPSTHKCIGFEGRETCTFYSYMAFSGDGASCEGGKEHFYDYYLARWQRKCVPGFGAWFWADFKPHTPFFDEEVGAWNVGDQYFYKGAIEFPTYAMKCEKFPKDIDLSEEEKRKRCKSAFQLTDRTFFSYSFPRALFWKHEEFQERLRQKLGPIYLTSQ